MPPRGELFVRHAELRFFRLIEPTAKPGLLRADDTIGRNVTADADIRLLACGQMLAGAIAITHVVRVEIAEAGAHVAIGEVATFESSFVPRSRPMRSSSIKPGPCRSEPLSELSLGPIERVSCPRKPATTGTRRDAVGI